MPNIEITAEAWRDAHRRLTEKDAEIERLKSATGWQKKVIAARDAEIERLTDLRDRWYDQAQEMEVGLDKATIEIERLRAALEKHHLPPHASPHPDCGICGEKLAGPKQG